MDECRHFRLETILVRSRGKLQHQVIHLFVHKPYRMRAVVLGGGAWGTALAIQCVRSGKFEGDVVVWARDRETVDAINTEHENTRYFKGHALPHCIRATTDKQGAITSSSGTVLILFLVVPTPAIAAVVADLKLGPEHILVSCTKGILNDTLETPDKILERVTHGFARVAFLSGPSFAAEVADNQPTGVTIASKDEEVARVVQTAISSERFRSYTTRDVIGVEMGGALKNVLAIACGISDGLGFGSNPRAMLITRGLAEMSLLSVRSGAEPITLAGLAGVGDLILTCTSTLSRNYTVGFRLGRGETLEHIIGSLGAVAEGVNTCKSAHELAAKLGVETPVITGIYQVIHEGAKPLEVLRANMKRPLRQEALY